MIVWLASYPKNGNTWLRSLISDYKNFKDEYSFEETVYSIKQFPQSIFFDFLLNEGMVEDKSMFKDLKFISKHWINSQRRLIMSNQNDFFLKTHAAPFRVDNNYFLSKETTRCAICIIRDPRQVLFSLMNHYNLKTQKDSLNFILDNNRVLDIPDSENKKSKPFSTLPLPSWQNFYLSWIAWKEFFPILFVKYEEMFKLQTFENIIKFLETNINDNDYKFDKQKIEKVFNRSNFDNLKKKEKISGFAEASNKTTAGFFLEGKTDTWKAKIEPKIKELIEKKFEKLMKKFNYI